MKELKKEYLAVIGQNYTDKTVISCLNEEKVISNEMVEALKKEKIIDEYGEVNDSFKKEFDLLAKANKIVQLSYVGKLPPFVYGVHFHDKEVLGVMETGDLVAFEKPVPETMIEIVKQYLGDSKLHHEIIIKLSYGQALIVGAMFDIQRKYNMHGLIVEESAFAYKGISENDLMKFIKDEHKPNWQWLSMVIKQQSIEKEFDFKAEINKLVDDKIIIKRSDNNYTLGSELEKLVANAYAVQNMVKIMLLQINGKSIINSELVCLQFGVGDLLGVDCTDNEVVLISLTIDNVVEHFMKLIDKEGV